MHQLSPRYPHYEVLNDAEITKSAKVDNRRNRDSLMGIVRDVMTLRQCDHLVVSFSSNVSVDAARPPAA